MRVLVVDTETTGLSPDADRLIELGLVLHDSHHGGVEVGAFDVRINPGRSIPAEVSSLTGLSAGDVAHGVDERAALSMLSAWMQVCDVVVGWNVAFDRNMLTAAAARTGTTLPARPWRCACEVARAAHPEWPRHRLIDAVTALGIEVAPTHRALDDAHATLAVWRALVPATPPPAVLAAHDDPAQQTTAQTTAETTQATAPTAALPAWRRLFA
jgi:DNA polymerase III epsilon subunit-like protein